MKKRKGIAGDMTRRGSAGKVLKQSRRGRKRKGGTGRRAG